MSTLTGALTVGTEYNPGFSTMGASLMSYQATVGNTTGWVISSAADYFLGNVLTNTQAGDGTSSCGQLISSAPIPASGLGLNHLWHLFWTDGSGDLNGIPQAIAVGGVAPTQCASPSFTPTQTASITPSHTPTSSKTPSGTSTVSRVYAVAALLLCRNMYDPKYHGHTVIIRESGMNIRLRWCLYGASARVYCTRTRVLQVAIQ